MSRGNARREESNAGEHLEGLAFGALEETTARLLGGSLGPASSSDPGAHYKSELERLLNGLDPATSSRFDLFLRESRGAWLLCTQARSGRALFIGNALSGTLVALARLGFEVTMLDVSAERLAYARARDHALGRHAADSTAGTPPRAEAQAVLFDPDARLPFAERSFELVVVEGGASAFAGHLEAGLQECRRVARGEIALTADNRFGYKLSSGHRGDFRVPGAFEFLRSAVRPSAGRRSLAGYRGALGAAEFERPRAFSLYPHSRDFSLVARCTGDPRKAAGPRLSLGPKERANRLKMVGYGLGLFPVFTSSFALLTSRRNSSSPQASRFERILSALAERLDEPAPELEHLIATRGNSAVLLTAPPHGSADGGRWAIHVPLSPRQELRVRRNYRRLGQIAKRFPGFPHASPLFAGEIDGAFLTCQRRLPGLSAPQISGERPLVERMLGDVAQRLTEVVAEPAQPMDAARFEQLVGARFDLVGSHVGNPRTSGASTLAELERMRAAARERMLGSRTPLVLYHADLRSKHVQVRADGSLIALLDWGSSEQADLPYFDLLNLLVHERQHEQQLSGADAWAVFRERRESGPLALRPHERQALDDYAQRLDLDADYCRAIEAIFPVLVGGMAEKHWDFSRPRWLTRLYGIGAR